MRGINKIKVVLGTALVANANQTPSDSRFEFGVSGIKHVLVFLSDDYTLDRVTEYP